MAGPDEDRRGGVRGREVVVPLRLYKTVTVFTTLIAIAGFVGGFMLLDAATNTASAPIDEVNPALAVAGLLLIAAGSAVWIYGTRFRAAGMGKPKDESGEGNDNG